MPCYNCSSFTCKMRNVLSVLVTFLPHLGFLPLKTKQIQLSVNEAEFMTKLKTIHKKTKINQRNNNTTELSPVILNHITKRCSQLAIWKLT